MGAGRRYKLAPYSIMILKPNVNKVSMSGVVIICGGGNDVVLW